MLSYQVAISRMAIPASFHLRLLHKGTWYHTIACEISRVSPLPIYMLYHGERIGAREQGQSILSAFHDPDSTHGALEQNGPAPTGEHAASGKTGKRYA